METLEYKNISFTVFDVGGQAKVSRSFSAFILSQIRALWKHYYLNTQGIIFVVDSNDPDRIADGGFNLIFHLIFSAREELHRMLQEEDLRDAVLLVFANKQDLPNASSPAEITESLQLHSVKGRPWYIQATCAKNGDGLCEGLDWLSRSLEKIDRR